MCVCACVISAERLNQEKGKKYAGLVFSVSAEKKLVGGKWFN